eukprot:698839-Ditylum_brightwellii.AAC.1
MGTGVTGAEEDGFARSFLTIWPLAAPAVLAISASTSVLWGYLDTKTPLVILVIANIVNLALDVVLVLGGGMGPTGAAIATTTVGHSSNGSTLHWIWILCSFVCEALAAASHALVADALGGNKPDIA